MSGRADGMWLERWINDVVTNFLGPYSTVIEYRCQPSWPPLAALAIWVLVGNGGNRQW
jgi:hypothetical protein